MAAIAVPKLVCVIDQFLLVIALPIRRRVAHDLHDEISPVPRSVVTGVEVVSVQENNIRQAKLTRANPKFPSDLPSIFLLRLSCLSATGCSG